MDPYVYSLPFDSKKHPVKIYQGKNGPISHKKLPSGHEAYNAVDFSLPVGTEVLAIREGTVAGIMDGSEVYYEGTDPKKGLGLPFGSTNIVMITHDDGTQAFYYHFAKQGVTVNTGDRVAKGEVIGVTGLSGWIGDDPHLHIQVNHGRDSLPIQFEGYDGPLEHDEIYPLTPDEKKELTSD